MQLSKGWIVINEEWSIVKSVIFTTEHWYSVFYWSMYCHWYMYMLPTLRVKVWQMVIGKYIIMYIRKTHVVFLVFVFFFCFISCTKYVPTYLRGLFENYCDIYSLSLWAKVKSLKFYQRVNQDTFYYRNKLKLMPSFVHSW